MFKELLAKRSLLSVGEDARESKEEQPSDLFSSSVKNSLLASVTASRGFDRSLGPDCEVMETTKQNLESRDGPSSLAKNSLIASVTATHDTARSSELGCGVMAPRLETTTKQNLESKDGPSKTHRLASVGACLPGDNATVQRSRLECGLGGAATRFETVIKHAPVIPGQSEGRGLTPPSTTDQSASPSTFEKPCYVPSRQYKANANKEEQTIESKQLDKERKTVDKEQASNAVGWWAGGTLNISRKGTDAKGIPSNLIINPPLYPTSSSGTRVGCSSSSHFNGCAFVCCSPSRDTSLVAGSRDTSLTNPALKSSPSSCRSGSCRCVSSVCLCRDYEKPQG